MATELDATKVLAAALASAPDDSLAVTKVVAAAVVSAVVEEASVTKVVAAALVAAIPTDLSDTKIVAAVLIGDALPPPETPTTMQNSLAFFFDLKAFASGEAAGGWFYDQYTPGAVFHYGEEGPGISSLLIGGVGTTTGHLFQYAGNDDAGQDISCAILTPSRDQGDPRLHKLYGDIMLDADTDGVPVSATPALNNNETALAPVTVQSIVRTQAVIPLGSAWQTARNLSLLLEFAVNSNAKPLFFIWEPRWTFESAPISALAWEISPTTFGMDTYKHGGMCKITHVSTADLSLVFTIDGVAQAAITIPNSAGIYAQTVFRVPVMKGKVWKLRLSSTTEFRFDTRDSFFEIKPWGSESPYQELRIFGDFATVEG